jgi:uncharacterized protein (TIGR03083 family)
VAYDWITDALAATWSSIEQTIAHRSDREFDAPTACPGWSVRDVVNHITGTELFLAGTPTPPPPTEAWPPYVKNALGEANEAFVVSRRHLSPDQVRRDFHEATRATLARLGSLDAVKWERNSWSPEGQRPLFHLEETRVLDSWIHLQDIRDALLEPADDHGPGEEIVLNRFEAALPYVLAKRVGAPEGTLVRINLNGRLGRSVQLQVRDGRGVAVAGTRDVPDLELTTAVALFWRRAAGRINAEAFLGASATDVRGDRQLARALAQGLNVTP